ncbi:MAG TPA: aminotransferase class V-fold PLP-dependent enzyme [Terriglobales bacterium]|nr:aminotransferase class V-fold PLP-dependent enzyme [Terriglobales bacterium]
MSTEEFRQVAEQLVSSCAALLESLETRPAFPTHVSGAITEETFREPLPFKGMGGAALASIASLVDQSRVPSPRFFGYVFGSGDPIAALGDLLASVLNQNVTAWRSAPAAVTIERTVVAWLAEAIGCAGFAGSLCGGGSSANLMGLAMAREAKAAANQDGAQPGVIYTSTEAHMSIAKAAALLGLGHKSNRFVSVQDDFRMDVGALARAIDEDVAVGKRPIAVVATAGTVNTGAIDPLAEVAEVAHSRGAWFHIDGAYGALAAIAVPEKFRGLEQADSLSLDPHKWLYQPADCGCLLYKDPGWARVAFSHSGDYARPLSEDPVEGFAFFEESMELSRRFRALKLWLSLRFHGIEAFRASILKDLRHAELLRAAIERQPALELLAIGQLSAVCFRFVGKPRMMDEAELDRINSRILRRVVNERGRVFISNASIHGKFALRACVVNHRSTEADIEAVVTEVLAAAVDLGVA